MSPGQAQESWGAPTLSLMDLPQAVAARDIHHLQLCHFHLASRDPSYLGEVRASLSDAGVTLSTLLIDDGDITHPTDRDRDRDWIGRWIDAAAELGAGAARVIAGKQQPTPETLACSVEGLRALARRGAEQGVRVTTENWLALTASPKEVHHILDRLDGEVGFMADFGNWKTTGPAKYDDLASILARSEDTHAKAWFPDGGIDAEDFGQCLERGSARRLRRPLHADLRGRGRRRVGGGRGRARFRPELFQRRPRLRRRFSRPSGRRTSPSPRSLSYQIGGVLVQV